MLFRPFFFILGEISIVDVRSVERISAVDLILIVKTISTFGAKLVIGVALLLRRFRRFFYIPDNLANLVPLSHLDHLVSLGTYNSLSFRQEVR